jgi:hypothetical protein
VRGVHPQLPPAVDDDAAALLPFAGAAKTENCTVCFRLPHFGQVTPEPFDITMRSWRVAQSSQTYS